MNLDISGTESEQNVKEAFACESQARNRYTYFAKQAKIEGDEKAAELFESMADNELEHARVWYKVLNGGMEDVRTNLEDAARREHEEWNTMYPTFAQKAREEGLELLAIMFENIAVIERNHELLFLELLADRTPGGNRDQLARAADLRTCGSCGYVTREIPDTCPVCGQRGTFQVR